MRGPATLRTSRTRAELGPLRPAPAHSQMSLRDGIDVRLRGGIRRAGGIEGRTNTGGPDRVGAGPT